VPFLSFGTIVTALNLPEGINGVPDILDEAAWLPRFLYRLRHELMSKGYGTGGVGLRICGDAFGSDNPNSILAGSWQDTNRNWVASGEDPWSTYRYAGACAHLAYCLSQTIGPSAAIFGLLCAPGLDAAATPPRVPLAITNTESNSLLLSWPSESTGGLVLQHTTNLATTNWTPVPQFPADDGTNRRVLVVPTESNQNFRLKGP